MSVEIRWNDVSYAGNAQNSLGYDALKEAINIIISTSPGERLFDPEFGCDLESVLFEPIDNETSDLIRIKLIQCIQDSDPRIQIDKHLSTATAIPDDNRYDVYLVVNVLGVDQPGVFYFSLNRWLGD